VSFSYEADCEAAIIATDTVITTSASDGRGLVGVGVRRSSGQRDKTVTRYSVALGSRNDQNPYTVELEAIVTALRCMPDALQRRERTVLSSPGSNPCRVYVVLCPGYTLWCITSSRLFNRACEGNA
jgi:hypothetical protein